MKKKFSALVLVLVVGAVFYWQTANGAPPKLEVGTKAPDFSLTDSDGKLIKLSDLSGKTVVLEWVNPDCPFVKRHYNKGTMKSLAEQNGEVVWLAVNSTHYFDSAKNAEWKKEKGLAYSILDDHPGTVGKLFDARTTPHMFIVDGAGMIRYQGAIDNDRFGSKDGEELTNYVASALGELNSGKDVSIPSTKPYGCSVKYAD